MTYDLLYFKYFIYIFNLYMYDTMYVVKLFLFLLHVHVHVCVWYAYVI